MNILLISVQKDLDVLGIKYLHYTLIKNNYNSTLLFLPKFDQKDDDSLESIKKLVNEVKPELIGFSLMSLDYYKTRDLTIYLKNLFKSIPIVWGGIHPTTNPEMCLKYADYICIGEGEKTILDLAASIAKKEDIKNINNLCYSENGEIKRNLLNPLIDNLDDIESYEHIPINSFTMHNKNIFPLNRKLNKRYAKYWGTIYSIMGSRGCPLSCTYCCNNTFLHLYKTKKIRKRSVSNMIAEIERAVKDNPEIKFVYFQDDCFLAYTTDYLEEFSKMYNEKVGKPFIIRSIPIFVNEDKLRYLKEAGLKWVILGLETGSDRVNKEIYKRTSYAKDFLRASKIVNELELAAFYDVILDNPYELEEDKFATIQTLIDTPKPFYPKFFSLEFYPGTELYDRAKVESSAGLENYLENDLMVYRKNVLNDMTRMSPFVNKGLMNKLINLYKKNPEGLGFKILLNVVKPFSSFVLEPLVYFKVAKLSQDGSYVKTFGVLQRHFKEGVYRYFNQFRARS